MKIVYLHQYFCTPLMTGGTRSYEMARRLVAAGHEVHIITSLRSGDSVSKSWLCTVESGVNVHWFPVAYSNSMSFYGRVWAFLSFAFVAAIKAASIKADVVFATSTPLTIAFPAVYTAWKNKTPMVFEVRDLWPAVPVALGVIKSKVLIKLSLWLEQFAYCNARRIIALAPGMKVEIAKTGYPANKIEVIPNGADLDLFTVEYDKNEKLKQKLGWMNNEPLVIYTGTLGILNGIDYLVYLSSEVRKLDINIRFLVIGDGKEGEKIKELARSLNVLNSNFFMIGEIPKKEIPMWLSAADLVMIVLAGPEIFWKHSVANKFFDALAAGRPIASNLPGWCEVLAQQAGAGIILDPTDYSKAAHMLVKTLHDKEWMAQARSAALKLAREEFARDLLASKLEQVLFEVVGEGRR